jgi:hypothetical protein
MAVQLINIGNVANDGTGDDLREAMVKINQNFEELDLRDDEQTTGLSLGFGAKAVFKQKLNYELQFRGLAAGDDITLTQSDSVITIAADGGIKTLRVQSDLNTVDLPEQANLHIAGGANISTAIIDGVMYISYSGPIDVVEDTTPILGGNLDADSYNISNVATLTADSITANSVVADLTGLVYGIDVRNINSEDLNFGGIITNITSNLEFFTAFNNVDFGTINSPANIESDFGTFV